MTQGAGFFGKLASHGDFVSRRLPPAFVAQWDAWLQEGMAGSREMLGARWLDAYLGAPVWRFALAPGVCGMDAWAGVLMPSVDRVGRYFPLTLACSGGEAMALAQWADDAGWYGRMEELALSTLGAGFSFERFDEALCEMSPLPAGSERNAYAACGLPRGHGVPTLPGADAQAGEGFWWTEGEDGSAAPMLRFTGLPPPQAFAAMLASG